MAGKPKPMSQIKQMLRLYKGGNGKKTIARTLGISKNTVKSYLAKIEANDWSMQELLELEDPVLERKFHGGNPAYKQGRYEHLKGNLDYYVKELGKRGVTKQLLWEEYIEENPGGYRSSQFYHHILQHQRAKNPSMVLEHLAGDKLLVDFAGKTMEYVDRETGEIIECQVFVACLAYSDYAFAMAVPSQGSEDFIHALQSCLHDLGGVPKAIVPDNLKAAVIRSHRYEPQINATMDDFANHYGTTVLPARPRKPKDKALVENQVKLIYNRVYAKLRNTRFFDIGSLNAAIAEKVLLHNQTRMQGRDYCREEKFLAEEKPLLGQLPAHRYEIKHYKSYKVAQNNHVRLTEDSRHYSVPFEHIGKQAQVVYTKSTVSIFVDGQKVAVHPRNRKAGYSTEKNHLCSAHRAYLKLSPEYYKKKAKERSTILHDLFCGVFSQNRHPEQLYKTCDGLLSLQRKADPQRFGQACETAMLYGNYSYRFIKNILDNNMEQGISMELEDRTLPSHENVRGNKYFSQITLFNKSKP